MQITLLSKCVAVDPVTCNCCGSVMVKSKLQKGAIFCIKGCRGLVYDPNWSQFAPVDHEGMQAAKLLTEIPELVDRNQHGPGGVSFAIHGKACRVKYSQPRVDQVLSSSPGSNPFLAKVRLRAGYRFRYVEPIESEVMA